MFELAPIVLFVYSRPEHTLQALEALSKNDLANESILYVFCDGPKESASQEFLKKIEETRGVVLSQKWCKEVHVIESDINKGLADSIVQGVTEVVNRHGKVIVLEDDLITSVGFLKYMNESLSLYEDKPEIKHISAYMYPVSIPSENIVFLKILSCWGWATWKRAWNSFEYDIDIHLSRVQSKIQIKKFDIEGHADFYGQLKANKEGWMKTWAVRWYASWMYAGGMAIFPHKTLVFNIGHDGSGDNCPPEQKFYSEPVEYIEVQVLPIVESQLSRERIDDFYKQLFYKPPFVRLKNFFLYDVRIMARKILIWVGLKK